LLDEKARKRAQETEIGIAVKIKIERYA